MSIHEDYGANASPFMSPEERSALTDHQRELRVVLEEVGLDLFFLNSLIGGAADESNSYQVLLTQIQQDVAHRLASLIVSPPKHGLLHSTAN